MIDDIRKAVSLLSRRTRWRWIALIPLAALAAVVEAAGALAVFALLRLLADPSSATDLPGLSLVSDSLPQDPRLVVLLFTLGVMVVYIVRGGALVLASWMRESTASRSVLEIARSTLSAYLTAPYAQLVRRNSSSLIHRVQRSSETTASYVLAPLTNLVTEGFIALGLVAMLVVAAPPVTTVALVATTVLLLVPVTLSKRFFRSIGAAEQRAEKSALLHLQQCFGAMKEVKLRGREQYFLNEYTDDRAALCRVQRRRATASEVFRLLVETLFVAILLSIVIMVVMRGVPGREALSLLGLYAYAGFRMVPSANRITLNTNVLRNGLPFVADLVGDFEELARSGPAARAPRGADLQFRETLALEAVSFSYGDGRPDALSEVTLTVRRGESVGIVGPTGSGKTTLLDVILGVLEPTRGHVKVDARDIRDGLRSWQQTIGYVPQTSYLLDDTLRSNIAFGLDAEDVDAGRLSQAVRLAQLDDVIAALPSGLDTRVGEDGAFLSGGQRQRVAIARALYEDPAVLVFDEATAALDTQTERELTRAIESLRGDRTILVVAHRLSTVRHCDRLVFLREGRVTNVGSFDELVERDAAFRALATAAAQS